IDERQHYVLNCLPSFRDHSPSLRTRPSAIPVIQWQFAHTVPVVRGENIKPSDRRKSFHSSCLRVLKQRPHAFTFCLVLWLEGMSALPPKADMCSALAHVCFGPKADMGLS